MYHVQAGAIPVEKGTFPPLAAPGLYRVPSNVSNMRSMIRQGSTLADVLLFSLHRKIVKKRKGYQNHSCEVIDYIINWNYKMWTNLLFNLIKLQEAFSTVIAYSKKRFSKLGSGMSRFLLAPLDVTFCNNAVILYFKHDKKMKMKKCLHFNAKGCIAVAGAEGVH